MSAQPLVVLTGQWIDGSLAHDDQSDKVSKDEGGGAKPLSKEILRTIQRDSDSVRCQRTRSAAVEFFAAFAAAASRSVLLVGTGRHRLELGDM